MKKAEILFCRPTYHNFPLFAWSIMLFQGYLPWRENAASHVVLKYTVEGVDFCTHITGNGVHLESLERLESRYTIVRRYSVDINGNSNSIGNWIVSRLDKVYDNWQIFGFVVSFLGITKTNVFGSDLRKYVCSEYIAAFMATFAGWKLGDSDNWDLNRVEDEIVRTSESW